MIQILIQILPYFAIFAWLKLPAAVAEAMGKVHGSLARAGKVKNQTPKAGLHSSFGRLRRV